MAVTKTVNNEMNIPSLSVQTMVKILCTTYISAIRSNYRNRIRSVFLWGAPGVGKTQGVYEIADEIEEKTGKKVVVTDIRLLHYGPTDLIGLPVKKEENSWEEEGKRQFVEWIRPKIFDLDPSEDMVNLLFLDELSSCPQSIQAAAYQITLDRTIGEHKLPENTIIIAAGNRTTDNSVAYRMSYALSNRLMHYLIEVDFDSWHKWAVKNHIHPLVTGYLSYAPAKLYCLPEEKSNPAFPTPRTWQYVSDQLYINGITEEMGISEEMYIQVGACIGIGAAIEFSGWCNLYRNLPSARDICNGCRTPYPNKQDALYALVSSLVNYISMKENTEEGISRTELENMSRYAERFPADFKALLYSDLLEIPELDKKLIMVPAFRTWMNKTGR